MSVESNGRKFKDDRIVNLINSKFISLKDEDMKRYNEVLHAILNEVIATIKGKNEFFKDHYQKILFVGSYYKGTKVGKPEEFDLNLVIQLPVNYESIKFDGNVPGYTKIKLDKDSYKPSWELHSKTLGKWVTPEGYLNQEIFRQYIESSFANMPKVANVGGVKYELGQRKSGPAFTICVKGPSSVEMHVDLVPVLEFRTQPPVPGTFTSSSWFAVPKSNRHITDSHLYWRMSFYDFEKALLKKNGCLKPVVRQLKKLRDTENWKIIASYHIETLTLHRIKAMEEKPELQKNSTTEHFVDMLRQLKEACETNRIINFWDKSHNLIEEVKPAQLIGIKGRLEKIIKQIEKDPFSIADHVLTKQERISIESELNDLQNSAKSAKSADQRPIESPKIDESKSKHSYFSPPNLSTVPLESIVSFNHILNGFTDLYKKIPIGNFGPAASVAAKKNQTPINVVTAKEKNQTPINVVTAKEKSETTIPATTKTDNSTTKTGNSTTKTDNSTSKNSEKMNDFAEMMNMMKSIRSEMADTKDAINLLTRRVIAVEGKIDVLLSRSDAKIEKPVAMINPTIYSREFEEFEKFLHQPQGLPTI